MQLGRTFIGAIIGAAIGITLLVGAHMAFEFDSVWLALPVAILTGLGVRMMVATGGHASYLRGALTCILALGAYLGGCDVVARMAQNQASSAGQATRIERPADDAAKATAEDGEVADEDAEAEEAPAAKAVSEPPSSRPSTSMAIQQGGLQKGFSALDFIVLSCSALIAYELGRGTAGKPVVVGEETRTEVPVQAHPDA
jgi:hypothetical protein